MYPFLRRHFRPAAANTLITIYYFALLCLVVFFLDREPGPFRYLDW